MTGTIVGGNITPHFSRSEMACQCCGRLHEGNMLKLCEWLEKLREVYGPMLVNSGHRCPERNVRVGGAWNSQHLESLAADILVNRDSDRYKLVELGLHWGARGVGIGKSIVHFDLRSPAIKVMWVYPVRG